MKTTRPAAGAARHPPLRRALLAYSLAWPALAAADASRRLLAPMTEGPFYPPARWRARSSDWDADLTQVRTAGGTAVARGEHLGLQLMVVDRLGRTVDGAEVEIWQCDSLAAYRHPQVPEETGRFDPGFQGFGAALSGSDGGVRFRTIRPVPYPGRTPHIHVKLRHAAFGELSSQLFVAGDPGNAADGLWRRLPEADREALAMRLQAAAGDGLRWRVRHELVVPG